MGEKKIHNALTEEEKKFLEAISDPEKRRAAVKILKEAGSLGASPQARSARRQA